MRTAKLTAAMALAGAVSLTAAVAPAQSQDAARATQDASDLGKHQRHVRLDIGVRTQFVRSKGLDPFSRRDALPQLTLAASSYFWSRERFSLGAGLAFDYGARSNTARSGMASLDTWRFTLAPEARYHVLRVLAVTAKVGPSLTRQAAVYSGVEAELSKTAWKAGLDAMAGVSLEAFGYRNGKSNQPRLWVSAEGGYGWTASQRLLLTPDESASAPQRLTPLDFGQLSLSGPLFRVTAGLSFL